MPLRTGTDLGKPFQSELDVLAKTFAWARALDLDAIRMGLTGLEGPLLVVGSGGSLSTASMIADLWNASTGNLGKFETPYLAKTTLLNGFTGSVVIVSAGGENPDVLGIARQAIRSEVRTLMSICCRKGSSLSRLTSGYGHGFACEYDPPSGSDGFLATNTLVGLNTIICRAFGRDKELPKAWKRPSISRRLLDRFGGSSLPTEIILLYGFDARPAAVDFESKFSEAALATVQSTDLRNFAHGRHNWIAKRPDTGVIALIGGQDKDLLKRTLDALPSSTRTLVIASKHDGVRAAFDLQAAVFELTLAFGKARKIDPGRPGIPPFGSRIYHLNAFPRKAADIKSEAISRKRAVRSRAGFADLGMSKWDQKYKDVVETLRSARFGQLIFDYDGTLCDHRDRLSGLRVDIAEELQRLLRAGIPVGIATGRGKSVRTSLRDRIASNLWPAVTVGYYNSSVCASLSDGRDLTKNLAQVADLQRAYDLLQRSALPPVEITLRPTQLTIETKSDRCDANLLWRLVQEVLHSSDLRELKVVSSSRSIDILLANSSKLDLLKCMPDGVRADDTLFIGDRPRWPGNDYEMLSQRYALSVDDVGPSLDKGWNLAPAGILNADCALHYLKACKVLKTGYRLAIGAGQ